MFLIADIMNRIDYNFSKQNTSTQFYLRTQQKCHNYKPSWSKIKSQRVTPTAQFLSYNVSNTEKHTSAQTKCQVTVFCLPESAKSQNAAN